MDVVANNGHILAPEIMRLPSATRIARVHLRVAHLDKALGFYGDLLGLNVATSVRDTAAVRGSSGDEPLLLFTEDCGAKQRTASAPGLFHMAFLYPSRRELATLLKRLLDNRWPLQGFADHGVSEAIYLADPEGNGIELCCDKPRDEWPYLDGQLQMVTEQLNLDDLMAELPKPHELRVQHPADVTIGHIHLQVSDLREAERFYHGFLGFDITQRNFPGALFLSAGGYHHHVGVNTWHSKGASPSPERTAGLIGFTLQLGAPNAVKIMAERAARTPHWAGSIAGGFAVLDNDTLRVEIQSH